MAMDVTPWILHQGWCVGYGRWPKAPVPAEHAMGYGPRFSALMGEWVGTYGNGRRMVQTFCASVLGVPISLGAIQKVLDRVTQAIDPYYVVIAQPARQAPGNYIDETPWYCDRVLEWLWVMASAVEARQTCLAHLIRTARGWAERQNLDRAACGQWALAELQRLCHRAKAPPHGGQWRAW